MTDRELMQQTCAVPLHEQLASVPENARLVIDDPDGMGTRFIPVGRLCREAAAALRERLAQPDAKRILLIRGQKDKVVAIYRENDVDILRTEMKKEDLLSAWEEKNQ